MPRHAQHLTYSELPREHLFEGSYQRAAVRGDHSLVTFNWLDPAMPPQPPHCHDFDQVSLVTEGAVAFEVEGKTFLVRAGEVLLIPANAAHTGVAVGDGVALNIDVYAPPRPDYLHLVAHQDPDGTTFVAGPVGAADQLAVERLHCEWADLLDSGRPHDALDLLTSDVVVIGLGPDERDRDGISHWADARAARTDRHTHHHITNVRCTSRADGDLDCTAYVGVYVLDQEHTTPHLEFVGRYDDVVRRTPAGLRFVRRRIIPMR